MALVNRQNPMGLRYVLSEHPRVGEKQTKIQLVGTEKSIIVNHQLDRITAMWWKWQMGGEMIQNAFSQFTPEEREFLITGITPSEWNQIFTEDED